MAEYTKTVNRDQVESNGSVCGRPHLRSLQTRKYARYAHGLWRFDLNEGVHKQRSHLKAVNWCDTLGRGLL